MIIFTGLLAWEYHDLYMKSRKVCNQGGGGTWINLYHSHTEMQLIPLEKIYSARDSVLKARE